MCFKYRLLKSIEQFEQKLINSQLLSNTSAPAVVFQAPNFVVSGYLTCSTVNQSFPGISLLSSNSLGVNVSSDSRNLTSLIDLLVAAAIDLPKDFASNSNEELSPNRTNGDNFVDNDQCSKPVAVIFHIFKNAKLFQSASADGSNLAGKSDDLSLGDDLRAVNSLVVSASLTDGLNTSYLEKEMSFLLEERMVLNSTPHCSFWNDNAYNGYGKWSQSGCHLDGSFGRKHLCRCSHLTNFAILMDLQVLSNQPVPELPEGHQRALEAITYIGCAISIVALVITLITMLGNRKNRHHSEKKVIASLCTSLLMTYIFFLVGLDGSPGTPSCKMAAVMVHYSLLSSFSWMFVLALSVYLAIHEPIFRLSDDINIKKSALFSWGSPAAIVAITAAIDSSAYRGKHYCRLETPAYYISLMAPSLLLLVINNCLFIKCGYFLLYTYQHKEPVSIKSRKKSKKQVIGLFGFGFLVGVTWLFGIPMFDEARLAFQYIFSVLNSLQGLYIFIFRVVLVSQTRKQWQMLFQRLRHDSSKTESCDADMLRNLPSISTSTQGTLLTNTTTQEGSTIHQAYSCSENSFQQLFLETDNL